MKRYSRILACLMAICLMAFCLPQTSHASEIATSGDLKAALTTELAEQLGEEYQVEVTVVYRSPEYLEEHQFNARRTNYFGYYLDDLDKQFAGQQYVFTVNEAGETEVVPFEAYDNSYDVALRNFVIGSGVIVVCVTVSAVSGALGASAVKAIFAASARTAGICGASSGVISAATAGVTTAVQGGDMDESLRAAARVGSTSYMWGTITGAAIGGASKAKKLYDGTKSGLTMNQVAEISKTTKLSPEILSQIKSPEEAAIYQQAGLKEVSIKVGNETRTVLMRDIDLNATSTVGGKTVTNLERMRMGYAAIDPATGDPFQLHHVNQEVNGMLAMLTEAEHQGNAAILNTYGKTGVHQLLEDAVWNAQKKSVWQSVAKLLGGN